MKRVLYAKEWNRAGRKLEKGDTASILIRAYLGGKNKYFSTGIYVRQDQWKNGQVVKHPQAAEYNEIIQELITGLTEYERDIKKSGRVFQLKLFEDFRRSRTADSSFIGFIKRERELKTDVSKATMDGYEYLIRQMERHGRIVQFSDLTYENIQSFDNFLRKKGNKQSSIHSYHKRLKVFINAAIGKGSLNVQDNPYLQFVTKVGKSDERKYLDWDELKRIEERPLKMERLQRARDVFVFCCYTGLAWKDAEALTPDNVIYSNNGIMEATLKLQRKKSMEVATIPLLPKPIEIIEKYKGYREGKLLPVVSNQKMNAYLQEIADLADVEMHLTSHVARHTFATSVSLLHGVPIEVLQKMLGHSDLKTTQIYAKMVDSRIENEMLKLKDKLS
jgi:integrase